MTDHERRTKYGWNGGPQGVLDNDLYKFSMQQAVLELYPNAQAKYQFTNRRLEDKFNDEFVEALRYEINHMQSHYLDPYERDWLQDSCSFLKPHYLGYLESYRFNPEEVEVKVDNGELAINIEGPWHKTILWEVPLMSLISELYFLYCDTNWNGEGQQERAWTKAKRLTAAGCRYADFGTRRRRSFANQNLVVGALKEAGGAGFTGTSNVMLAKEHGIKPIGTMAHEWIMAISALEGLRHANRIGLYKWMEVYKGNLGIALTDTYTTDVFFRDFDSVLSRLYDGIRQDSACPFEFIGKAQDHYQSLNIPPTSKAAIFSDGLTTDKAIDIQKAAEGRVNPFYGIGTHFTNDFDGLSHYSSRALNMVIKLWSCNNIPVVKLSDDPGKAQGDEEAVKVAKWTFLGESL